MSQPSDTWNPRRLNGLSLFWYKFSTSFGLAVDSIRAHKLRSFLTLLGVIIGVGSVILVGAAIDGLGTYAEKARPKRLAGRPFWWRR